MTIHSWFASYFVHIVRMGIFIVRALVMCNMVFIGRANVVMEVALSYATLYD